MKSLQRMTNQKQVQSKTDDLHTYFILLIFIYTVKLPLIKFSVKQIIFGN